MTRRRLLLLVAAMWSYGAAYAQACSLTGYDTFPPRKLTGAVQSPSTAFAYGSDLDTRDGQRIIWNYITNQHASNDLSLSWERAGIILPYFSPLPAGETYCNDLFASNVRDDDIDENAIIIYGNINQTKKAAVYGNVQTADSKSGFNVSRIESKFRSVDGDIRQIKVEFFFRSDGTTITDMGLINSKDFYAGIFDIGKLWSPSTLKSMDAIAAELGTEMKLVQWAEFAQVGTGGQFNFITQQAHESPIIKGSIKGFGGGEPVYGTTSATLVVFDDAQRPIASGRISVPITLEQ